MDAQFAATTKSLEAEPTLETLQNEQELWQSAQGHMGVLHPELVGNVTREDLLAQAEQL